jgi:osmoprotectant transport system permease protein
MPVLRATVAGVEAVPPDVREAARAMGLTPREVLLQVEAPLALPVVGAGLRVALVLAVATAAVGALAGASTLGTPIVLGLRNGNELAILQGAAATASLAFLTEGASRLAAAALRGARAGPVRAPLAREPGPRG